MTGLVRNAIETEDGRLISPEPEITFEGHPVRAIVFFEVEPGEDLVANDSRFPPPLPRDAQEAA